MPHLIPVAKGLGIEHIDAILGAGVLCVTACTFLLNSITEGLNSHGLRLRGSQVDIGGSVGKIVEEAEVRDPGVVFEDCAYRVEFPEGDLSAGKSLDFIDVKN